MNRIREWVLILALFIFPRLDGFCFENNQTDTPQHHCTCPLVCHVGYHQAILPIYETSIITSPLIQISFPSESLDYKNPFLTVLKYPPKIGNDT